MIKKAHSAVLALALTACSETNRNMNAADATQDRLEYLGKENARITQESARFEDNVRKECLQVHREAFGVMNAHFRQVENGTFAAMRCAGEKNPLDCKKQAMLRAGQPSEVIQLFAEMNVVEGAILNCMQAKAPASVEQTNPVATANEEPVIPFEAPLPEPSPFPLPPLFEKTEENLVLELTDAQLETETADSVTVIKFYANWCEPCRLYDPIFEDVAKNYFGPVKFFKIDADKNPRTVRKFEVQSLPMTVFLYRGRLLTQLTGVISEEILQGKIRQLGLLWKIEQAEKNRKEQLGL